MALAWSRYTALVFAIGLAIGEAVINWGHWQWWPLWVVDYGIVVWLLYGFVASRDPRRAHALTTAWAFAFGVFYIALFATLDGIRRGDAAFGKSPVILVLMAIMTILAALGVATGSFAHRKALAPGASSE
ncbi:MAG: hypothetical protein HUU46_13605 [Candidatus Hydrogenedentes bacterium]|nr:hypothetical protein [Candidatus Hydrogenedentota bacterium]